MSSLKSILVSVSYSFILLCGLSSTSWSLYVVPGSGCESVCANNASGSKTTNTSDLVCYDVDYNSTSKGEHFKECINCELQSNYTNDETGASDLGWALYNLRAAFDDCVYGFPNTTASSSNPCADVSCQPIEEALEIGIVDPDPSNSFDYCVNGTFLAKVSQCAFCYSILEGQVFFASFLNVLQAGCEQTPAAGTLLVDLPDAFSEHPTVTNSGSIVISTSLVSSSSKSSFPLGAKVGLGVGLPLFCIVVITGIVVCVIKRRRKALKLQRQNPWAGRTSGFQSPFSPAFPQSYSQMPYTVMQPYTDDSPISPVQKAYNPDSVLQYQKDLASRQKQQNDVTATTMAATALPQMETVMEPERGGGGGGDKKIPLESEKGKEPETWSRPSTALRLETQNIAKSLQQGETPISGLKEISPASFS